MQNVNPCRLALASDYTTIQKVRIAFLPVDKEFSCSACNIDRVIDLGDNVIKHRSKTSKMKGIFVDDSLVMQNEDFDIDVDYDSNSSDEDYVDVDDRDDNIFNLPQSVQNFLTKVLE
jgi:hypothetical protein